MPVSNHSPKGLLGEWLPAVLAVLAMVLMGAVARPIYDFAGSIYESLDQTGWMSHDHDTPAWIQGNWIVGEYRVCVLESNPPRATPVSSLFCGNKNDDGYVDWLVERDDHPNAGPGIFHVLPVTYWGRIDRQDVNTSWRCQRNESALTCKALN